MRKMLFFLGIVFSAAATKAQVYRSFLDSKGRTVDSTSAASYILYTALSDTLWLMRQYSMDDTIEFEATYRDEDLLIPHGPFKAYRKIRPNQFPYGNMPYVDTINFVSQTGQFVDGKKEGVWREYISGGFLNAVYTYRDGKLNGPHEKYGSYTNELQMRGNYKDGKRDSIWESISSNGEVFQRTWFKDDKAGKTKNYKTSPPLVSKRPKQEAYDETLPVPPGGDLVKYMQGIEWKIRYPVKAIENRVSGIVEVSFVVEADGTLGEILVRRGVGYGLDEEVVRVLKASKRWVPGMQNGKPVRVSYSIPFRVNARM